MTLEDLVDLARCLAFVRWLVRLFACVAPHLT